jgi:hypothetical protein
MAEFERVFSQHNANSDCIEWFFRAREGLMGPFETEDVACQKLNQFIQYCRFDTTRIYTQRNDSTGEVEWFFVTRDGIEGPYPSEDFARIMLIGYVETKKTEGLNAPQ